MGRIKDLYTMVKERRLGFAMDEVMSGDHEFMPGMGPEGRLPFEFRVTWGPRHLIKWINPLGGAFMTQPLEGTVTVGGMCTRVPCSGTLELAYFTEAKIRYTFEFVFGGKTYHFVGEKIHIRPWNLHVSHTTCYGTLKEKDTGKPVSKSVTHFRFRTTPAFLASLRFA
ncbi:conserved hypothetical protein [Desulfatibacillum aliphaticivorans]|uniref:Uncharacterized protein n=1 Tax=Desulfatibacillum aliphaticivorans TaxID=218208 RepID=B8FKP6_DESAL|nr:hypothetical protein [Desulfatibacillum aliphaticivorans]ACL04418.1 conserved hypothetical protein [Desulfatibacillum aliphaticivorans]